MGFLDWAEAVWEEEGLARNEQMLTFMSEEDEDEALASAGPPTEAVACFVCKALWFRLMMRLTKQDQYICPRCIETAIIVE